LTAQGISYLPAVGKGTTDDWPPEPSVLALGLEFTAAQALAVKYQQNAYLSPEKGFPPELIFPDPEAIALQTSITVIGTRKRRAAMVSTWTEYLCIRKVGEQIELSIRMYEGIGEYYEGYPRQENRAEVPLPKQIGGKAVMGVDVDAEVVFGGELTCISDDQCALFERDDLNGAQLWLDNDGWDTDGLLEYFKAEASNG